MTDTVKVLSDDEVAEIEARHANRMLIGYLEVAIGDMRGGQETITLVTQDIPALCATVRALRVESKKLKDRLAEQRTQNRHLWEANKEIVRTNTALREQLAQARADVDKFSTLADERHDLLSAERRANDDLRSERARMLQSLERAQQARNAYQAELAQVTQERDELRKANKSMATELAHQDSY